MIFLPAAGNGRKIVVCSALFRLGCRPTEQAIHMAAVVRRRKLAATSGRSGCRLPDSTRSRTIPSVPFVDPTCQSNGTVTQLNRRLLLCSIRSRVRSRPSDRRRSYRAVRYTIIAVLAATDLTVSNASPKAIILTCWR